jgi:DNA-binding NarL/FixJ family response regulator
MMSTNHNIRVVIAGDCKLFRECLYLALDSDESIDIVGEAVNGLQVIDMIGNLKPDVVLLNMSMPEINGLEVLPAIKQKSFATRALMLPATMDEATILRALKSGAKGYLSKNASISTLISAIKAVNGGELWIERKLTARLFDQGWSDDSGKDYRQKETNGSLTSREKEVLNLLKNGWTNKKIANTLCISEKTVKSHLNSIFRKLNVSRRLQAILYAIKQGLC